MHLWQTVLCFFDAHPWFIPSVGAVIILLTTAYKITTWIGRMIATAWRSRQDRRVLGYLFKQIRTGSREPDAYGHVAPLYIDCSAIDIANALDMKPFKTRAILERLKEQHRVKQIGKHDMWCISEYEIMARQGIKQVGE
jgi:hypothetical protein